MTENLCQSLIDLRCRILTSQPLTKLALDHLEHIRRVHKTTMTSNSQISQKSIILQALEGDDRLNVNAAFVAPANVAIVVENNLANLSGRFGSCLNQPPTLCMPYRFEPGVNIEFGENVFDVIVNGGRADVQLIGNYSGAGALC